MADNQTEQRIADLVNTYTSQASPSEATRVAQSVRNAVFSDAPEVTGSREAINSKIQELYNYDKDVGSRYRDPNNEMFIENPLARWQAEGARKGAISGEIGDLFSRLGRYQDLYGNVVEEGMKAWKDSLSFLKDVIGFERDKLEREDKLKELDRQYELDLKRLAQSASQGTAGERATNAAKDRLRNDIKNFAGARKDESWVNELFLKYVATGQLSLDEFDEIYNQESPFGPRKERTEDLFKLLGTAEGYQKAPGSDDPWEKFLNEELDNPKAGPAPSAYTIEEVQ